MIPTILIGLLVAVIFFAIVGKGIYNRKHHKAGCGSCGGNCGACGCCGAKPQPCPPPGGSKTIASGQDPLSFSL